MAAEVLAVLVVIAILLAAVLAHHWAIHPELSFPDRVFQVSDVQDHESWAVLLAGLGAGTFLGAALCGKRGGARA
jgi:hypothetical protein